MASRILFLAPFALGALAQNFSSTTGFSQATGTANNSASAETTLTLFLDAEPDQGFVGSIVDANPCETTIALACTEGDYGFAQFSETCDGSSIVSSADAHRLAWYVSLTFG